MIAATLEEQKRAKTKFFALYIASVVLIIVIISSLWKNDSSAPAVTSAPAFTPAENKKLVQADALLHSRQDALDSRYTAALSGGKTVVEAEKSNLRLMETDFISLIDSLEKDAAAIKDEQQKAELAVMLAGFRKSAESRSKVMNSYAALLNDTTRSVITVTSNEGNNDEEMQELKKILVEKEEKIAVLEKNRQADVVEKDRTIASLQNQLRQKAPVVTQPITATGNDTEWKQKYAKLKTSYDNIAGQNNTLNRSYKTIVDDNRRLLSQLQAARKQ